MRRELLYLKDIVEAADAIERFLSDVNRLLTNDLLGSAVLQKLIVIGAANRLPKDFQRDHSEVDWPGVVAFRNITVHAYFLIDWQIVWTNCHARSAESQAARRNYSRCVGGCFGTSNFR
jgi:uncharacterized protein with HEPN domain